MKYPDNVTLQINISPGDISYAQKTIPELVRKHQELKNRILIVDCNRPQKTKLVNPDIKYPLEKFKKSVEKTIEIAKELEANQLFSKVYYLTPKEPIYQLLSKKYLNNFYDCTHSAGGTANMSYWAGIELPTTRYVAHYDGDMLLYQEPGYTWIKDALEILNNQKEYIIATPSLCPNLTQNSPNKHIGRPFDDKVSFFVDDWFSTRIFLLDKDKMNTYLPLIRGKIYWELLLRKIFKRAFPRDPEIVMFKSIGGRGGKRVILKNQKAWVLHPANKSTEYINLLPQIIRSINNNLYPKQQIGFEDILLDEWIQHIQCEHS